MKLTGQTRESTQRASRVPGNLLRVSDDEQVKRAVGVNSLWLRFRPVDVLPNTDWPDIQRANASMTTRPATDRHEQTAHHPAGRPKSRQLGFMLQHLVSQTRRPLV